jgi:hypothetical protein
VCCLPIKVYCSGFQLLLVLAEHLLLTVGTQLCRCTKPFDLCFIQQRSALIENRCVLSKWPSLGSVHCQRETARAAVVLLHIPANCDVTVVEIKKFRPLMMKELGSFQP